MAVSGTRRAALLVTAAVVLSCPACTLLQQSLLPGDAAPAPPPAPPPAAAQAESPQPAMLAEIVQSYLETPASTEKPPRRRAGQPGADGDKPTTDCWDRLHYDIGLSLDDYRNYYSWPNLGLVALGLAGVAPIANTSADNRLTHWYQSRVHNSTVSRAADVGNVGGQLWVVLPVALEGAALLGWGPEGYDRDGGLFEWSNRSLRAIAVGFPPVIAEYFVLGSSRPDRGHPGWQPFQDIHGASGHTFIGAVPFLTAASMTDSPWLKYPLILGSFFTGWSRFHEDRHYFSQVALGWWMAYVAVRSVNQTQASRVTVVPGVTPNGPGMALEVRY